MEKINDLNHIACELKPTSGGEQELEGAVTHAELC